MACDFADLVQNGFCTGDLCGVMRITAVWCCSLHTFVHWNFSNSLAFKHEKFRSFISGGRPGGHFFKAERPEAFTVETTAPVEREMRELNRRFENGGQWTQAGAENLLRWHQVYRHAPEQWAEWFTDPEPTW